MIEQEMSRRGVLKGAALTAGAAAAAASTAGTAAAVTRPPRRADLVVVNGNVVTMDPRLRRAQALAIKDGRIVAVGTNREIRRLAGRRTEVVDAERGTVLPGINDSHVHFGAFGTAVPPLSWPVDGGSITEIQSLVAEAVAYFDSAGQPEAWIRGRGWNDNRLGGVPPTRWDIDAVSGNHPVLLGDFSGHAVAVNSKVLQLAGVTRDTVPPTGGVIEKDENGEPTGVFRESASALVQSVVPPFTEDDLSQGMDAAAQAMHSLGITSITDPGIGMEQLALYRKKVRAGELPIRFNIMMRGGTSVGMLDELLAQISGPQAVSSRWLRVAQIKLIADGIPTAAQTAFLHDPYVDGSNAGLLTAGDTPEAQLRTLHTLIRKAVRHGFQVGTHATGDAAIDAVVAGYLAAMGSNWRKADLRHYVIHADLTPRSTLRKMAAHDIGANMNATIKYLLGRTLDPFLGPERTDYQWPYRTALDLGVKVSSASDAPVTPPSWLQGVTGAVTREGQFGGVAGKAQRISVEEALASYTRTPAWQDHAESWKGMLRRGYAGDVCIVGGNVLTADPRDLPAMDVTTTVVGGDVVYDSAASTARRAIALSALTRGFSHDEAVSCLEQGNCCCRISEKMLDQAEL